MGSIKKGYDFGLLALNLTQKLGIKNRAWPLFLFNGLLAHWKNHLNTTIPSIREAYEISSDFGDAETAAHCAYCYTFWLFCTGTHLEETAKEQSRFQQKLEKLHQKKPLYRHQLFRQTVAGLLDLSKDPSVVDGEFYRQDEMLQTYRDIGDDTTLFLHHQMCMITAYLFDHFHRAEEHGKFCSELTSQVVLSISYPVFVFYYTLTLLHVNRDDRTLRSHHLLSTVKSNLRKMSRWSNMCKDNYEHKYFLMEAVYNQVQNNKEKAAEFYDKSISAARRSGYLQEEALGLKLASRFYFEQERYHLAKPYLLESLNCYRKWGAKAIVAHLEKQLKKTTKEKDDSESQFFFSTREPDSPLPYDEQTPWFDAMSVIKTSRTFAGEVVLGDLLRKLITILLENAGGQTAFLLLKIENEWVVRARADIDDNEGTLVDSAPIVFRHAMSQTIVNYVGRSLETVVLNNACIRGEFTNDPYIIEHEPKSILCMPILHQGDAIGILYLENNLTQGAFRPDRLEILNLIASQAAVSIRNSMLFEELEETIQKLDKEVGKRKETQIQLMHAGKLSALGRLSASIAHEFGNPLIGIKYLLDDLGGRENLSDEDRNLVKIGLDECARMKDLINDLHDFHRPSTGTWQLFNLNNTVENVLFFQRKNLKNIRITVETRLDPHLPLIRAVEDQITQTIVSLTINAADAMAENGGHLILRTSSQENYVLLEVEDNGCGIPPDLQEHVFEPFFSTKEAIDGTGLGLAIAYSIVTSHKGEISFTSTHQEGTIFRLKLPCAEEENDQ